MRYNSLDYNSGAYVASKFTSFPVETITDADVLVKAVGQGVRAETVSPADSIVKAPKVLKSETETVSDAIPSKSIGISKSETVTDTDTIAKRVVRDSFRDVVGVADDTSRRSVSKTKNETVRLDEWFEKRNAQPNRWAD